MQEAQERMLDLVCKQTQMKPGMKHFDFGYVDTALPACTHEATTKAHDSLFLLGAMLPVLS
jgi:hypothetical protein